MYLCVNIIFEIFKHTKAYLFSSIKEKSRLVTASARSDVPLHRRWLEYNVCRKIRMSTSLLCTLSNTNFFLSKSCPRLWIPCWLLTNTAVTSAVTNFRCHKLIAKLKKIKEQWHGKFYLQSVWGKTHYFKHRKYLNLWMNNKVRGD